MQIIINAYGVRQLPLQILFIKKQIEKWTTFLTLPMNCSLMWFAAGWLKKYYFKSDKSTDQIMTKEQEKTQQQPSKPPMEYNKLTDRKVTARLKYLVKRLDTVYNSWWRNLLQGIIRGIGIVLGMTLAIAVIVKILSMIVTLNIPYITDWISDIIRIIQQKV